jgi:predicted RNA-binding Zn ribbon-like protein
MIELEVETENFSFVGGWLCLDFANTVSTYGTERSGERLHGYADLVQWGREAGVLAGEQARRLLETASRRPAESAPVFDRALALRESIHWIFSSIAVEGRPENSDLDTLNNELSRAMCHSQIIRTEHGFEWSWTDDEGALDRVLWDVAKSAAELLTSSEDLDRVRECGGETCGWLFLDMSRNHSRHWCDMRDCGNRAKAKRHYQRKKSGK